MLFRSLVTHLHHHSSMWPRPHSSTWSYSIVPMLIHWRSPHTFARCCVRRRRVERTRLIGMKRLRRRRRIWIIHTWITSPLMQPIVDEHVRGVALIAGRSRSDASNTISTRMTMPTIRAASVTTLRINRRSSTNKTNPTYGVPSTMETSTMPHRADTEAY